MKDFVSFCKTALPKVLLVFVIGCFIYTGGLHSVMSAIVDWWFSLFTWLPESNKSEVTAALTALVYIGIVHALFSLPDDSKGVANESV